MIYPTATLEIALADDPTANYTDTDLILAPLQYYRLDEASGNFADSSGNGYTGTAVNSGDFTYAQTGALSGDANKALKWNVSGTAYINKNPGPAIPDPHTIEVWVKRRVTGARHPIYSNANTTAPYLYIDTDDKVKAAGQPDAAGAPLNAIRATSSVTLDTNWHHIVYTSSGSTATLYVDGVDVTVAGSAYSVSAAAAAFHIGAAPAAVAVYFDGLMDEFALYPAALTAAQVAGHYQSAAIGNPTAWTDVTAYFLGGTQRRGRQHELDTIQAGTAAISLRNTDRRFDPANSAGPYYGTLLPMRRLRLKWTINSVTYTRFLGFIERWPRTRVGPTWSQVDLTVVDGFEQLAQTDISDQFWASESVGARIAHVLDLCLWPRSLRAIDTGTATVPDSAFTSGTFTSALSHIQQIADSDLGYFFIDSSGLATYHSRYHRETTTVGTVSQGSFGDSGSGGLAYVGIVPDPASKDHILNDVSTTPDGGSPQRVQDGASIRHYFQRSLARTALIVDDGIDPLLQSQLIVAAHKDPIGRIESVQLRPGSDLSLWAQVLGREIGDRVTVSESPPGGGPVNTADYYVEAMQDDFPVQGSWESVWQLTPVASGYKTWVLDDPVYSVLDSTTVLG